MAGIRLWAKAAGVSRGYIAPESGASGLAGGGCIRRLHNERPLTPMPTIRFEPRALHAA
jgi:hypothetical protein